MNKQDWISSLREFSKHQRSALPIVLPESLSAEEEWQYRIIGGSLISWLQNRLPTILEERSALQRLLNFDPDPIIVITTTMPGLVAAQQIIPDDTDQIIYLLHSEFETWERDNIADAFVFHIHHFNYFKDITPDLLDVATTSYPNVNKASYRLHSEGDLWGDKCGLFGEHLWEWDGNQLNLLEEAISRGAF